MLASQIKTYLNQYHFKENTLSNASQTLTFSSMPIIEPIQKALAKNNYKEPTPIQEQAIPALLDNRNLLACSQTGTVAASFIIPIYSNSAH